MRMLKFVAVIILFASQPVWADDYVVNEYAKSANKFAVVWDAISKESPSYKKHIDQQVAALTKLWQSRIVENVYLNHELNEPEQERKASIVFFINAKDADEANNILKKLPFVKHDVLSYTLHPVGLLWLR
ncbi:hypothetical protein [Pontibacterium sp.]|uniref:hypothetical protein n=1 Tax=Pontibacterium sp. TaxID=2036026 RepID=UPI0035117314